MKRHMQANHASILLVMSQLMWISTTLDIQSVRKIGYLDNDGASISSVW